MAKNVYCVIDSYDEYFEIFDSLEKAKKDFIKQASLLSPTQIQDEVKRGYADKVVFIDEDFTPVKPTEDMLFSYFDSFYNHNFDVSVSRYMLLSDYDDSLPLFFNGCRLIKRQVH